VNLTYYEPFFAVFSTLNYTKAHWMAQTQKFLILLLYLFLCVTAATYVIIFISRNNAVKRSIFGDFQKSLEIKVKII
jgi:hypothetical protein